jgi:hypothetical protein
MNQVKVLLHESTKELTLTDEDIIKEHAYEENLPRRSS